MTRKHLAELQALSFEERRARMEMEAYHIQEEYSYEVELTEEEKDQVAADAGRASLEVSHIEEEIRLVLDPLKAKLKEAKAKLANMVHQLDNGSRWEVCTAYFYQDMKKREMAILDEHANEIGRRPLEPGEGQLAIGEA